MSEETLFELPAKEERPAPAPTVPGEARVLRPVRDQLKWGDGGSGIDVAPRASGPFYLEFPGDVGPVGLL